MRHILAIAALLFSGAWFAEANPVAAQAQSETKPAAGAPGGGANGQQKQPPAPAEAARLNSEVVKLYREGKYAEALPLAESALAISEKELGREAQPVAVSLTNVAALRQRLGHTDKAKEYYKRALAIFEREGDTAQAVKILETLVSLADNLDQVVEFYERALALKEKQHGAESAQAAAYLYPLGHYSELRGDFDKAETFFTRFLAVAGKVNADVPDDVGAAHLRVACLLKKKGRSAEARESEKRAVEVFERVTAARGKIAEGGVYNGKALSKPQPAYPAKAKELRMQGEVRVHLLISEAGNVIAACGEGPHWSLERASEVAAYQAQFTPTTVEGKPVKVRGVISYKFVLR